jgi:uncharacterized protein (TIGR03083 family)
MESSEFDQLLVDAIHSEGIALIEVGQLAPSARVPSCPDWTVTELIGHASGAHRWANQVVLEGTTPQSRVLPEQPKEFSDLVTWYYAGLGQLESTLGETDPDALVWTPTSGVVGSRWWRRKMAVETAIHRWDAENAVAQSVADITASPLDRSVAYAGIVEYLEDFLPGMIAYAGDTAPQGSVSLRPSDSEESFYFELGHLDSREYSEASCSVEGTASNLLLWIWNRLADPAMNLQLEGSADIVRAWRTLAI